MPANKTQATTASVADHIAARGSDQQRQDCARLIEMLSNITQCEPRMWGPSIVGFGTYCYRYDSGREGEACLTGFAIRKTELVVYLVAQTEAQTALRAQLGKHKLGKACLYFKRLSDLDTTVLAAMVQASVAEIKRRYGKL